ncbi:MAG TPA: energy transducer TonB [Vicinamibacterales bacterium]
MARDGLRSHLSGTLPISIVAHFLILALLLIVPLAANVALPPPDRGLPEYVRLAPPPVPPAFAVAVRRPSSSVVPNPHLAPTAAPLTIQPEIERPGPQLDVPIGSSEGLPTGFIEGEHIAPPVAPPPADPSPGPATVRIAQLPQSPHKVVDVRPVYPELARIARVDGTVTLEAVLDTSGRVTQLRVVRSVPMLDQAALDAVRQWRYSPSVYGGRPVSVLMTITIRFTLNQ